MSTSFPSKMTKDLRRAADLLTSAVGFVMGLSSLRFLVEIGKYGQKSVVLGIPMVLVHSVVFVSFIIIGIVHLTFFLKEFKAD